MKKKEAIKMLGIIIASTALWSGVFVLAMVKVGIYVIG